MPGCYYSYAYFMLTIICIYIVFRCIGCGVIGVLFNYKKDHIKHFRINKGVQDQMTYETYVYSTKNTYDQFCNLLLYFLCIPNQKIHHLSPLFFLYEPFCFLHGHKQYSIQYTDIRLFKTSI